MAKRPTRDDVAKLAGVSVATVSYVINDGPRPVAEDTRARVLEAVEQLGYRPHAIARSLKTGRTCTVGLLIPTLLSPGFAYLINEVEDCLASQDYALVLASSHEDSERERRMLDVMVSQSIDGLLYTPSGPRLRDQVAGLIENDVPVVFLDRYIPGVPADTVMTDNVQAGRPRPRDQVPSDGYRGGESDPGRYRPRDRYRTGHDDRYRRGQSAYGRARFGVADRPGNRQCADRSGRARASGR